MMQTTSDSDTRRRIILYHSLARMLFITTHKDNIFIFIFSDMGDISQIANPIDDVTWQSAKSVNNVINTMILCGVIKGNTG